MSASAEKLGVARTTLDRVLNGRGGISADMALRFETVGWSNGRILDAVPSQLRFGERANESAQTCRTGPQRDSLG